MKLRDGASICDRGFTLLEMLVVLVIVSLVSVVLMQGMSLILNLRNNLGDKVLDLDRAALKRSIIRLPLEGLTADFNDGEDVFSGTLKSVSGLTIQPLFRRGGRPIPFALTLEYDDRESLNSLAYREDHGEPVVLATWKGDEANFRYIGDANGWQPIWPPAETPILGVTSVIITDIRPPQLPELVYLDTHSADEPDYAVAIQSRRNRIPRDPVF